MEPSKSPISDSKGGKYSNSGNPATPRGRRVGGWLGFTEYLPAFIGSALLSVLGRPQTLGGWVLAVVLILFIMASPVLVALRASRKSTQELLREQAAADARLQAQRSEAARSLEKVAHQEELLRLAKEHEERQKEFALKAQEDFACTMGSLIQPIADLLGAIGTDRTAQARKVNQGVLCERVISVVAGICGPTGQSRVALYMLDGSVFRLRKPSVGRGYEDISPVISPADSRYNSWMDLIHDRGGKIVPDVNDTALGLSLRANAVYKTFLNVTVYGNNHVFGLISVDAVEAGSLTELDLIKAQTFAKLLGAGLAIGLSSRITANQDR